MHLLGSPVATRFAGGLDGSMQVWSIEGRCLDSFDGVADQVPPCTHVSVD